MGTRSTIALEFADGTVQQIYCHWDGYLEHNGQILLKHYSNPFKLRDLIDMGAISSLCATIEATKETAYHFSRGEELVINKFKDIEEYYKECQGEEYDYILSLNWQGKAQWYVRYYDTQENWIPIEHAFENQRDSISQEERE
jgi:hypothetical protein